MPTDPSLLKRPDVWRRLVNSKLTDLRDLHAQAEDAWAELADRDTRTAARLSRRRQRSSHRLQGGMR
jgi:hypothetical protein